MPFDVIGRMSTRTTYARQGILSEYGVIDAGFEGNLVLNMFSTVNSVDLKRGDRITQVVFETLDKPAEKPYAKRSGNYQCQRKLF